MVKWRKKGKIKMSGQKISTSINNNEPEIWSDKKNRFYNKKKTRVTLNLWPDDAEFIDIYLQESNMTKSQLIREIINDWCKFISNQYGL